MPIEDLILQRIAVSYNPKTVGSLYDLNKSGKLIFNTEYQRSEVWPNRKKQLLIDSIIRQYDISMIFLRMKDNGKTECLDGQQRLKAIFSFMDNEFNITPKIIEELDEPCNFDNLPNGLKSRIREFILHAATIYDADDEVTSDIFLRLQEGMPLNSPEKLNAMRGKLRKIILETSHNKFFENIGLANTRFAHRYLAAQIIILELAGKLSENHFISVKFPTLKKYYKEYEKTEIPTTILNNVKSSLALLTKSLGTKLSAIKYRSDIVSIYTFVADIRKNYSLTDMDTKIGTFLLDFVTKVDNYYSLPTDSAHVPYREYAILRSSSADSAPNIKQRHEIIMSKFLLNFPKLQPKDPNRLFNYAEKLALYNKSEGKCVICSKETKFEDGEADHIKRHTDGGLTTIENGRWLCMKCHKEIHQNN